MARCRYILTALILSLWLNKVFAQCNLTYSALTAFNCTNSTGMATIIPINGTAPYTVTSNPPGVNSLTVTGLNVGTYNVLLTDANNCIVAIQLIYINKNAPNNLAFTPTNVTCPGGGNGGVSVVYNGATPPITYLWSNGSTNSVITNQPPGIYTVTANDSKSCSATNTIQITEPPPLISGFNNTHVTCFGSTLTSVITTTGGTSPYLSYTVNGTPTPTNFATNISAGVQTVTVKDNKNCIQSNTILVTQSPQLIIQSNAIKPSCVGYTDGTITSSLVTGLNPPHTFTWQPGNVNATSLSNLAAGNYTLSVADGSACITKSVVNVALPDTIRLNALTKKENCSAADGAYTLNVSGGTGPYTYTTLPIGNTNSIVGNISSGTYTTVIIDSKLCVDSISFTVGNLSTVSLSINQLTPAICYSVCGGAVLLNVINAVLPVTYSSIATGTNSTGLLNGLCAGVHLINAIDAIGCPATTTINITSPPPFSYFTDNPPVLCYGQKAVVTSTAKGGNGGYSYKWNPGNLQGNPVTLSPTVTTAYSLTVFDAKGCTLTPYVFTVNVRDPLQININASSTGICPSSTAQITPTISGGDGKYSYLWLPDNSKSLSIFINNISQPFYTLTVNDLCGSLPAIKVVTLNLFPVIKPQFSASGYGGCEPYCVKFTNTTPKSLQPEWNFGEKSVEQKGEELYYCYNKPGSYNVKLSVIDSNNCLAFYTYPNTISVGAKPSLSFSTNPGVVTLNNGHNVKILNRSTNAKNFEWHIDKNIYSYNKDIEYTFTEIGCYVFKLVAESESQCIDSLTKEICVLEGFNFYMPASFTPNGDGLNDIFAPKGSGWLYENYTFEVYNRWGKRIFETHDVFSGWDGGLAENAGASQPGLTNGNDIYNWRVSVLDNRGEEHSFKGMVMILR